MKNDKPTTIITLLLFAFFSQSAIAQNCIAGGAGSGHHIEANNVRALIDPSGSLFWDGSSSQFEAGETGQKVATIFAQGLWIAGMDQEGEVKLSAASYGKAVNNFDYYPGALQTSGQAQGTIDSDACAFWNRIWTVTNPEIIQHITDFEDNGIIDSPVSSIFNWPGKGNQNFSWPDGQYDQGFAPFFDRNADGIYSPQNGDYPYIAQSSTIPTEISWCVFNTVGGPANDSGSTNTPTAEIQLLAWAYSCPDDIIMDNALFVSYRIANRSQEALLDTRIGLWHDFDLGCYIDDFVGSAPDQNTFFVYNQYNVDSDCLQVDNAGPMPPVQAVSFLNKDLGSFIHMNSGAFDTHSPAVTTPDLPVEFYNYLDGRFRDGTPITIGGDGYNPTSEDVVKFAFPGDPNQLEEWSEQSTNVPFGDRRVLGSIHLEKSDFPPGSVVELDVAYSYHRESGLSNLGNVTAMYDNVEHIQSNYDAGFTELCELTATRNEPVWAKEIKLFPNPVNDQLTVNYGDTAIDQIQVWDSFGQLLSSYDQVKESLHLANLPAGIYYLRLNNQGSSIVRKIIKM